MAPILYKFSEKPHETYTHQIGGSMVYTTFHALIQRIGNQLPHQLHRNESTQVSSSKIVLEEPLPMPQPARSSGHDEILSVNP